MLTFCDSFALSLFPPQTDTLSQLLSLTSAAWPLDSYIFDMQWHRQPDWGGYEWDDQRYSNVTEMLSFMHALGLYTGMNLHDVSRFPGDGSTSTAGVVAADNPKSWAAFAAALGLNPSAQSADFDIGNRSYALALHEVLIAPLLHQGLDMCWYWIVPHRMLHVHRPLPHAGPIFSTALEALRPSPARCLSPYSTISASTTALQLLGIAALTTLAIPEGVTTGTPLLLGAMCMRAGNRFSL
jgi:hypothetical protein